jgi:trehalose synthase
MNDLDENAVLADALQRHPTVVTQKGLAEGFGLTVAKAMWKSRAVIGSAVSRTRSPKGPVFYYLIRPIFRAFADQVRRLLVDGALRARLGSAAHDRVRDYFVADLHLRSAADHADQAVRLMGPARAAVRARFVSGCEDARM